MITQSDLTIHDNGDGTFQIEACFNAGPESSGIHAIQFYTRDSLRETYPTPNCIRFICLPLPAVTRAELPVSFVVEECTEGSGPGPQHVFGPHFGGAENPDWRLNPCSNWDLDARFISPEHQACLDVRTELHDLRNEMLRLCAEVRELRERRENAISRADLAAKLAIALGVAIFAATQLPWPASIIVQAVLAIALIIAIAIVIKNHRERNELNHQIADRNEILTDMRFRYGNLASRMRDACCDRFEIPEMPNC